MSVCLPIPFFHFQTQSFFNIVWKTYNWEPVIVGIFYLPIVFQIMVAVGIRVVPFCV
jgi:hypothetical protein